MATGAVKTDWSKYELDDNGDFLTNDEGDFVERVKPVAQKDPAAPKPDARDQVTFLGSENLGKLMADVFPRVAEGTVKGRSYPAQVGAGLEDNLSLLGRGVSSTGAAPDGAKMKDGNPELGRTKGKGVIDRILRDPGTGAAILAAPLTLGASIPAIAGAGAIQGAASAAAHQGENLLEGREVSPKSALAEIALNALIPSLGKAAAPLVKKAGVKVFNSVVKPGKEALKKGYDTEKFLETGLGGSLRKSLDNTEGRIEDLADQVQDIITQKSRKATVTSRGPIPEAPGPRSGVDVNGGVVPEPGPANGLPPGVQKQIGPGSIPMGAPRPRSTPPDVAVTPNPNPMPARIDPRFARPQATSTMNQPPIPDAPAGTAYGIPPGGSRLPVAPAQGGPLATRPDGAVAVPGLNTVDGGPIPGSFDQGAPRLPPGAPETTTDITKIVDLLDALNATKRGMGGELAAGQHAGLADDIASGQAQWLDDLEARGMAGEVSPLQALTYQRGVGAMGKFNYGQNPQLVPSKARVANEYYEQIGDRLQEVAPEIAPLRREVSDLIPARMALTDALARTDKNFAMGLKEALAGLGALQGAAINGPSGALPGLGMAASIHASQSPKVGNYLFNQGKSMAQPSMKRDAIKRALLQLGFSEDDQEP